MPRVKLTEICAGRIGGRRRTTPIARSGFERGSKSLVGLDAQSATQTAQSLANARSGLRQKSPIAGCFAMSRSGGSLATSTTFSFLGPSSGILDARRDFEVGTAEAQAVLRKGAQAAAGRRERELADANLRLAQARSSYEVGWAQMGAEDSQWKLERSDLPIQGSSDGSITTTTTAGTQFVLGAFRMTPPAADQQANSPKTFTGFGGNEFGLYFSNGFINNGIDECNMSLQGGDSSHRTGLSLQL